MSNKLKQFKHLIAMSALSAVASFGNTAKAETNETNMAEIENVTQCPNGTLIIKKRASTENGEIKEPQIGGVPTPWMFARPDGQSAFANHFTTNATEVVSDGSNVYAHVKGKITHFTLSPDGIPSTNGVEYALTNADGSQTNTCEKLLATHNGELYTIDDTTNKEAVVFINRYTNNNERCFAVDRSCFPNFYQQDLTQSLKIDAVEFFKKFNAFCPQGSLKDSSYAFDTNGKIKIDILLPSARIDFYQDNINYKMFKVSSESTNTLATGNSPITGYTDGGISYGIYPKIKRLSGPITGLSQLSNGNVVACSEGHGCVELDCNNFYDTEAHSAPAITNAPTNTFKIIDNRDKKNGALLYVTRKNIGILSR